MKNKIKEGDMVEYNYPKGTEYRTFGLVEEVDKNHIWVQWLWTESTQGKMEDPEHKYRQNYLHSYNKDKDDNCTRLILIS
jgi:hypothetical protein